MRPYTQVTVLLLPISLAIIPGAVAAQHRGQPASPKYWLAVSTGYFWLSGVRDGSSGSWWDFGDAFPVGIGVDRVLNRETSLGLAFARARVPLTYASRTLQPRSAHATVAFYGPVLKVRRGGQRTLGATLEFQPGLSQYSNFQDDATGEPLPPQRNLDFGFSLGSSWIARLAGDWAFEFGTAVFYAFHERTGLEGRERSLQQHYLIRLGMRLGF
jgi:hypothetical protein